MIDSKLYTMDNLYELPPPPERLATKTINNNTFFFSANTSLSNFHPSKFEIDGIRYSHGEMFIQATILILPMVEIQIFEELIMRVNVHIAVRIQTATFLCHNSLSHLRGVTGFSLTGAQYVSGGWVLQITSSMPVGTGCAVSEEQEQKALVTSNVSRGLQTLLNVPCRLSKVLFPDSIANTHIHPTLLNQSLIA